MKIRVHVPHFKPLKKSNLGYDAYQKKQYVTVHVVEVSAKYKELVQQSQFSNFP